MSARARRNRPGMAVSGLFEHREYSVAQRDRRERILDTTIVLASKGGYDAVQMRAVAEDADVALGTVYRYFPSKSHLLIAALSREFGWLRERLDRALTTTGTPAERLLFVLRRTTGALQQDPRLTEAMTRAFMFADASVAVEVDEFGTVTDMMFARAVGGGEPTEEQLALARVVSDVWLSSLVGWVTGRVSAADVTRRLELTVRLLVN